MRAALLAHALTKPGRDLSRPAIVLSLIGLYAAFTILAGGLGGAISLAVPLAIVAMVWAMPFGVSLANGDKAPLTAFTACLILFTVGSFRARGWNDQSLDWQVLAKLAVWTAAGGIALLNFQRTIELLRFPHVALCVLFVMLLPISALWAADPIYALASGLMHLCVLGFCLTLVSRLGERGALMALAIGTGCVVLPSLALSPFTTSLGGISAGSTGELDRVRGLTGHPVALASISAQFAICMIFLVERKWVPRLLGLALLAMALGTILVTQSRMPALALVGAGAITLLVRQRLFGFATPLVAMPSILLVLAALALGIDHLISEDMLRMISRSGRAEEILTLSGRSEIWAFVAGHIANAPVLGYGQGAGPAILFTGFKGWSLVHAHNLYLQVALCLGFVGLAVLVAALLVQIRLAIAYQRTFPLFMTSFLCLYGVTETSLSNNLPDSTFIVWALSVALTLPRGVTVGEKADETPLPAAGAQQVRLQPG